MQKLKKLWEKFKWHVITGLVVVILIFLFAFNLQDEFASDLNKWMFKKRKKMVKKQIDKIKNDEKQIDKDITNIEKQIEKIDERVEDREKEIDKMDLKELNEAFKALGF